VSECLFLKGDLASNVRWQKASGLIRLIDTMVMGIYY